MHGLIMHGKGTEKNLLRKKNLVKIFTRKIALSLINANRGSELTQSYWRTYHCIDDATVIDGKFQTHHYCKNRFCPVCARVRSAIIINGYSKQLSEIKDLSLLTLTVPNVSAIELKDTITDLTQSFRQIVNRYNNKRTEKKFNIDGVRKIECTYNHELKNYHPHLHVLCNHKAAQYILANWLKMHPTAKRCAQDIKPADKDSIKEIAKYFSKIFSKDKDGNIKIMPPQALDTINLAFRRVRTFQSFGKIKMVKEDFNENELKDGIDCTLTDGEYEYMQAVMSWVCTETGEVAVEIPEEIRNYNADTLGKYLHDPEDTPVTDFHNTDAAISAIMERKRIENGQKTALHRAQIGKTTAAHRHQIGKTTAAHRTNNG